MQTQHCIPSFLKICDINTYDIFTDTKKDKYKNGKTNKGLEV